MAFEEDPVLRRLALESAAARTAEEAQPSSGSPAPTSEPGIADPVKKLLKIAVALGLIHELGR